VKKVMLAFILTLAMLLALSACGGHTPLPNPPLVLGEKYLFDLDYEQAVVQFDQAIKIDPKNPRPWVGKLIVDVLSPADPDNPSVPKYPDMPRLPDFPDIPDDPTPRVFFPPIIEWYRQHGWTDLADKLLGLLERVFPGEEWGEVDSTPVIATTATTAAPQPEKNPIRITSYDPNGELQRYEINEYDEKGNLIRGENHYPNGDVISVVGENSYDSGGLLIQRKFLYSNDNVFTSTYEYNAQGQKIRSESHSSYGDSSVTTYEYSAQGQLIRQNNGDSSYYIYEYDTSGLRVRANLYNETGELGAYTLYEY